MIKKLLAAGLAVLITLTAVSCDTGTELSAPEGFRASIAGDAVEIRWDAVENADIYRLYRSGDEGESYRYIGDYSGLECRDAAGTAGRNVLYQNMRRHGEEGAILFFLPLCHYGNLSARRSRLHRL